MTTHRPKPDDPGIRAYQFAPLYWAVESSARKASLTSNPAEETLHATLTLLASFAALEALAMETVYSVPPLRDKFWSSRFRGMSIEDKFAELTGAIPSMAGAVASVVPLIAEHRRALTHSEPDNARSMQVGDVLNKAKASQIAVGLRNLAVSLWQDQRPRPVAAEFDKPNPYL